MEGPLVRSCSTLGEVKQEKQLVQLVFKHRGKSVVTVKYCKRQLRFLRPLDRKVVERALHRAGLAWLRRRRKRFMPKAWKKAGGNQQQASVSKD
jgi:hypothetical protein